MREVELKGVVADPEALAARLRAAGAAPGFAGRLSDRRYDTPDRALLARDHMLRVRVRTDANGTQATLDWKGPTRREDGYKVREEVSVAVADAGALGQLLERLGYELRGQIDRDVAHFTLGASTLRIERYPRMDALVEVEGEPGAIERAISATGLARAGFTADRLPDFVRRYEERTGGRAALSDRELAGDYQLTVANE